MEGGDTTNRDYARSNSIERTVDRLAPLSWPAEADDSFKVVTNRYFLLGLTLAWGVICLPALAHAADERITLMLAGTACPQSHAVLEQYLLRVPGVRQIDLHAIPDHILIDADMTVVAAGVLATQVNEVLAAQPPCRATIMKSCISAELRMKSGR